MKNYLIIALLLFSSGCFPLNKASRQIKRETRKDNQGPIFLASTHGKWDGSFVLWKNGHFMLMQRGLLASDKDGYYYTGAYDIKSDTIFFDFYKEYKPNWKQPYMLKDSSGKYLLYYDKTGLKCDSLLIKQMAKGFHF